MLPANGIPLELLSDEAKMAVQQAQRMMQAQQLVAFNQPQLMAAQPNANLGMAVAQQTQQQRSSVVCFECNKPGHFARDCYKRKPRLQQQQAMEGTIGQDQGLAMLCQQQQMELQQLRAQAGVQFPQQQLSPAFQQPMQPPPLQLQQQPSLPPPPMARQADSSDRPTGRQSDRPTGRQQYRSCMEFEQI